MKKNTILFLLFVWMLPLGVQAQKQVSKDVLDIRADTIVGLRNYRWSDEWAIGFYVGANAALGENVRPRDIPKVTRPSLAVAVSKYFYPTVGARIQGMYNWQAGKANKEAVDAGYLGKGTYRFHNAAMFLDVLFNIHNILFRFKEDRRFQLVAFFGVGGNYTFGFEKKLLDDNWQEWYPVSRDAHMYLALRAGLQANYQLTDKFDLTWDLAINATDDAYNGVRYDDFYDGYLTTALGVIYHFKDEYSDRRFKYTRFTDAEEMAELNRRINAARGDLNESLQPRVETQTEYAYHDMLRTTVSFIIDRYDIQANQRKNIAEVAKYIKNHDDINVVVCGFADVQTAYPEYNLKLSERRANAVYNVLVKEYGVDPSRVRIDYKGDTVQPYTEKNEWNRVVTFVTEPRYKTTKQGASTQK